MLWLLCCIKWRRKKEKVKASGRADVTACVVERRGADEIKVCGCGCRKWKCERGWVSLSVGWMLPGSGVWVYRKGSIVKGCESKWREWWKGSWSTVKEGWDDDLPLTSPLTAHTSPVMWYFSSFCLPSFPIHHTRSNYTSVNPRRCACTRRVTLRRGFALFILVVVVQLYTTYWWPLMYNEIS